MPRTPLLQFAADLIRATRPTGTQSSLPDLGRRDFLRGTAAAVATLPLLGAPRPKRTARVAVVGGGLAGLTCAYRLQQRGIFATVYEANSRLGGRCWTRRGDFAANQLAEHGGELIDQSHASIRHLAQHFQLPLVNVLAAEANGTEGCMRFFGAHYDGRDASRDLRELWQRLHRDLSDAGYPTTWQQSTARGRALDNQSIADWITNTVPGGLSSPLGRLLAVAYTIEYGAEIDQQSALNLIYLLGYSGPGRFRIFGPSNEKYKIVGGNDTLVAALVAQLGAQIAPQHRLLAATKLASGRIRLSLATPGPTIDEDFDHVVFALPFAVLRSAVDLTGAQWSARKLLAIQQLGAGSNSKLAVQFISRFWQPLGCNGETYSDLGYQASWEVTRGQAGTPGILVNYSGGTYAESFAGACATVRAALFAQQVEPLLPGSVANRNGLATLDTWHDNPFSRCSYSYWRVGQYQLFAGVEGQPEDNAWFCGEHCSQDAQGYLEGAVETGEQAAADVDAAIAG